MSKTTAALPEQRAWLSKMSKQWVTDQVMLWNKVYKLNWTCYDNVYVDETWNKIYK